MQGSHGCQCPKSCHQILRGSDLDRPVLPGLHEVGAWGVRRERLVLWTVEKGISNGVEQIEALPFGFRVSRELLRSAEASEDAEDVDRRLGCDRAARAV